MIDTTITKFLDAFLMQIGRCDINTIKQIVNDPGFENDSTPELAARILTCLKTWSKSDIEQIGYPKILNILQKDNILKKILHLTAKQQIYI